MIVAPAFQLASIELLRRDVWASVSVDASLLHTTTTVEFLRERADDSDGQFTLRLISTRVDAQPKVMWATSRTCPSVRDGVTRLKIIPMPKVVVPGEPEEIVLDGTEYRVQLRARYGLEAGQPIDLRSNVGTLLADWVAGTFAVLKPCWSTIRPKRLH